MAKAVAKVEEVHVPAQQPAAEADSLLNLIERAARDPNVDIDKMERLFLMRERMLAQTNKAAYLTALADMQAKLPMVEKRGTISKNEKDERGAKTGNQVAMTKYAKWEDVVEAITPVLHEHGFSLQFRISQPTEARVVVSAVLGHKAGHSEETSISLPLDTSGAKNNVQGWGSSTSYGKRYTAFALLNIAARGEDDDGKAAGAVAAINEKQIEQIQSLIVDANADIKKFLSYMKVDTLADIPAAKFDAAIAALEAKRRSQL